MNHNNKIIFIPPIASFHDNDNGDDDDDDSMNFPPSSPHATNECKKLQRVNSNILVDDCNHFPSLRITDEETKFHFSKQL
jgi:hypothetical protein